MEMNKELEANTTLSHYRIVRKLGAGGMAKNKVNYVFHLAPFGTNKDNYIRLIIRINFGRIDTGSVQKWVYFFVTILYVML